MTRDSSVGLPHSPPVRKNSDFDKPRSNNATISSLQNEQDLSLGSDSLRVRKKTPPGDKRESSELRLRRLKELRLAIQKKMVGNML